PKRWYDVKITKPHSASGHDHNRLRNWQINQPLFDGRGKWKTLTSDEYEAVNRIAEPLLQEYGYPKVPAESGTAPLRTE
ncbi:MAG: hypothetical protein AAF907_02670, partial [Planctomycetota bacterium]